MKTRRLGNSDLEIAPLAFGGNVFGWTADESTSFMLLDAFVDAGFNFIDTADVYSHWAPGNSGGESETVIGKWLKRSGKRDRVVIATKVGKEMGPGKQGLSPPYIMQAVEASLKRLQTDVIDLYQSHADDPNTPPEETMETYGRLIEEGKVRFVGASNYGADRLRRALDASAEHGYPSYQSLQPHYNLCERDVYENELEPVCREYGLGVIPYFSLASGFLTGKYRSEQDLEGRARADLVRNYMDDRGMRVLEALEEVSRRESLTPAKTAIAWLLARPSVTAPIASATTIEQLNELIEATAVRLDESSLALLDEAGRDP